MAYNLLNHIQGKNGSRWAQLVRETGTEHLLLVAVDAAKHTHKALICNYFGHILVQPFEFDGSWTGFERLRDEIELQKNKLGMKKVVVGIETTGHYYEDLVKVSQAEGYHVRIINAATTAKERETLLNWSKTDNLDLMAILQSIIHGRGTSSSLPSGAIRSLQRLTRARRELVGERTSTQNLIRTYIDRIFKELQGKSVWEQGKRKHVQPFSKLFGKAPRYIMRHCLHPSDLIGMGKKGLREISIQENLKIRDQSIEILMEFACSSITSPKESVEVDQLLLNQSLDRLDMLDEQIKLLERTIEDLFVQTDGAVILTVPGIAVVTGAELYAEMGDISDFTHAGQLIKMAGTNPTVKQSGGKRPSYSGISKQGRKAFRNITYQAGKSLAVNNPEMSRRYVAMKERGKHHRQAYIALGNRMIRLAFSMIRRQKLYQTDEIDYVLLDELKKKLHMPNIKRIFERYMMDQEPI